MASEDAIGPPLFKSAASTSVTPSGNDGVDVEGEEGEDEREEEDDGKSADIDNLLISEPVAPLRRLPGR